MKEYLLIENFKFGVFVNNGKLSPYFCTRAFLQDKFIGLGFSVCPYFEIKIFNEIRILVCN